MWHFDISEHHCHEEFTPLYTTHWDPRASSVWRQRATLKPISRCCARCASLYPSHSNLPLLFSSRLRGTISLHSFYPLLRRWITATIIPHALKWHPNTKLADTLTSTSTPHPTPPRPHFLEMCCNSKSDCHISFCRSREKSGKKSNENDDFSLLESGPVACNLLWHSTSSASLFNNFVHREHIKKSRRLVRVWRQVSIQTLNINGRESES